ncbi:MAG: alpha/beta fold hydrolase [Dehalococcoidia bacterium]
MNERAREEIGYRDFRGMRVASVFHRCEPDTRAVVVMAHGFKSNKIGPSRYFVDLSRALAERGVSSLRFDQPGCGDSEGAFEESSFFTWIDTIESFARQFHTEGRAVALLGQSMGGNASLAAAARLDNAIAGVALWSAGTNVRTDAASLEGEWMEEEGQRVRTDFWREAASLDFLALYRGLAAPVYIVYGTADVFIPAADARTVESMCKPGDRIRVIEGLPHSAWPEPHRSEILAETADTLVSWLADA